MLLKEPSLAFPEVAVLNPKYIHLSPHLLELLLLLHIDISAPKCLSIRYRWRVHRACRGEGDRNRRQRRGREGDRNRKGYSCCGEGHRSRGTNRRVNIGARLTPITDPRTRRGVMGKCTFRPCRPFKVGKGRAWTPGHVPMTCYTLSHHCQV